MYAHEYDQAINQLQRAISVDPTDPSVPSVRRALAWTYESRGMHEQALAEFIEAARSQNAGPERLSAFRRAYETDGMKGYWRTWLRLQHDRIERGLINPFNLARVYSYVGDKQRAFSYLKEAFNDHSVDIPALRYSPAFDDLRSDNRFNALMTDLHL